MRLASMQQLIFQKQNANRCFITIQNRAIELEQNLIILTEKKRLHTTYQSIRFFPSPLHFARLK